METPKPHHPSTPSSSSSPNPSLPLLRFLPFLPPPTAHRPPPPAAAGAPSAVLDSTPGCTMPLFRPYVARLPWHGGPRAFLSRLFPRYGQYCGPNWSSGRDAGLGLWDHRPVDWLDFCCYCHDMGYDSHNQAQLLKADISFLNCLESRNAKPDTASLPVAAAVYRSMCIAGLKLVLIPYRMRLVWLQSGGMSLVKPFDDLVGRIAVTRVSTVRGQKHEI